MRISSSWVSYCGELIVLRITVTRCIVPRSAQFSHIELNCERSYLYKFGFGASLYILRLYISVSLASNRYVKRENNHVR